MVINIFSHLKKDNIMLKPEVIIEYSKHYNFNLSDVIFVDNRLDVLRKTEEFGITSYHPS